MHTRCIRVLGAAWGRSVPRLLHITQIWPFLPCGGGGQDGMQVEKCALTLFIAIAILQYAYAEQH